MLLSDLFTMWLLILFQILHRWANRCLLNWKINLAWISFLPCSQLLVTLIKNVIHFFSSLRVMPFGAENFMSLCLYVYMYTYIFLMRFIQACFYFLIVLACFLQDPFITHVRLITFFLMNSCFWINKWIILCPLIQIKFLKP